MKRKDLERRVDDLERRVKELEARPDYHPPVVQPIYIPPAQTYPPIYIGDPIPSPWNTWSGILVRSLMNGTGGRQQ